MWAGGCNPGGAFFSPNTSTSQSGAFNTASGVFPTATQLNATPVLKEDRSKTNLIINYLPQRFEQHDLQALFEQIGLIRQCKLIRDKNNGASLCYGFVDYVDPEDAQKAINTFHGFEIEGKRLRVAYACSGSRKNGVNSSNISNDTRNGNRSPNENVIGWECYIFGVPLNTSDQDILKSCREYGNILQIKEVSAQEVSEVLLPQSFNGISIPLETYERIRNAAFQSHTKNVLIIYEERRSCDALLQRLGSAYARDNSRPLCFIGNHVTRETGIMLISQGSNPVLRSNSVLTNSVTEGLAALSLNNSDYKHPLRVQLPDFSERTNALSSQPNSFVSRAQSCGVTAGNSFFPENAQYSNSPSVFDYRSPRADLFASNDPISRGFVHSPFTQTDVWSNTASPLFVDDPRRTAAVLQDPVYINTPVVRSSSLTRAFTRNGGSGVVEMKLENLQPSGSVTIRAVEHMVRALLVVNPNIHIVVPSTGNAAVSAGVVASHYKQDCTVVVPESETRIRDRLQLEAPLTKIIHEGSSLNDAIKKAEQLVANNCPAPHTFYTPCHLINLYGQVDTSRGYATIIEELTTQPDVIVLPLGGGTLMHAIVNRLATRGWSSTQIVGVEPENIKRFQESFNLIRAVPAAPGAKTVAAGLNVGPPNQRCIFAGVGSPITILTVTEAEIVDATRRLAEECGLLLDPISAVAAAAIYNGSISRLQTQKNLPLNAKVLLLVTGGRNITINELHEMQSTVVSNDVAGVSQQKPEHSENDPAHNYEQFYLKTVDDLCNEVDESDDKEQFAGPITSSPKDRSLKSEGLKSLDFRGSDKESSEPESK